MASSANLRFVLATALTAILFIPSARTAMAEDSIESNFLSNVRQVTAGFDKAGEGYFSPDGKQIIYQAVPRGYPFYQIYTQSLAGGDPQRLSTGRGRTTCSYFHPKEKRVIFGSSHLDPKLEQTERKARDQLAEDARSGRRRRYSWPFDPHMEIFSLSLDGKNQKLARLTNSPGYDAECAYSSDGKRIVFCSNRDGDPDLYIMNADGSGVRQLTNTPGYDGGPFFSPDGQWVVFRSDRLQKERLQIYAIRTDGKHEVALTGDLNWVNWAPYWHPNAPYIIWCGADHSERGKRPNYDLWMLKYRISEGRMEPVGTKIRVTNHGSGDLLPVFSPDGKSLMWTSTRTKDHKSQLWIGDFKLPNQSESTR